MRVLLPLALLAACGSPSTYFDLDADPPGATLAPGEFRVEPGALDWADLDEATFAPDWLLPEERGADEDDFVAAMRALASEPLDEGGSRLGDLLALDVGERAARLEALVDDERSGVLRQLLLDDELFAADWSPKEDGDRDGIAFGEAWELERDGEVEWRAGKDLRIEQAAILVRAGLDAIKAAENDYRLYPRNVGASYEAIQPVADSYFRGTDPRGAEFAVHRIDFRSPLPFPFPSYECDLHVLSRTSRGEVVTDIFSPSDDFHYMLGRDVLVPVEDSSGEVVAVMCVRQFGFDLVGVPDGPGNRREAVRSSLGNLRRNAERIFARDGSSAVDAGSAVPRYELLGIEPPA